MTHFKRRQVLRWLAAMSGSATALAIPTSCAPNRKQTAATVSSPTSTNAAQTAPNLLGVTLRVAKYKGGWDLQLKLAKQDDFPYKVEFAEFTGGNLMVQAINAGALDLASGSEIPPIFAIESQAAVKIIAVNRGPTIAQTVLVPEGSRFKSVADLKGKRVGYIKSTTAHYFLLKMLKDKGLTFGDITPVALTISDGLSAFRNGNLDAWATYGFSIPQVKKDGATELQSGKDILSGNYLIFAAPAAIADTAKHAAIADFLCRLQKSFVWRDQNVEDWSKNYAAAINVDPAIVLEQTQQEKAQRSYQVLPTSDAAIASQQDVADTFTQAGILKSKVDVKPLWDSSFNDAISQCQ